MAERASLDLLLELSQAERQAQLAHFDSSDTKSGLVLGFAGVLIALSPAFEGLDGIGAFASAALAAGLSLASFWPRDFPVFDLTGLGSYAVSELAFTQIRMLDTLRIMLVEGQTLLRVKALRLKLAVISLSVSAVLTGLNITTGG
jgi:hypothetical protein